MPQGYCLGFRRCQPLAAVWSSRNQASSITLLTFQLRRDSDGCFKVNAEPDAIFRNFTVFGFAMGIKTWTFFRGEG